MPIIQRAAGSEFTEYNLGSVRLYDSKLCGLEKLRMSEHAICFYPYEESISQEKWEGQLLPRKHWTMGSIGFLPANSELVSTPDTPYREGGIRFDNGLFAKATEGLIDHSKIDFRFADVTDPTAFQLSCMLLSGAKTGGIADCPMLVESMSLTLAIAIMRKLCPDLAQAVGGASHDLGDCRKRRVVEYIEANLSKHIGLMELANVAALSQYHFSRQFHRAVGMSPMRYIQRRRVELAKHFLLRPDATIASVAYECGFGGQSHFTTAFKAATGVTPGEYRRSGGHLVAEAA